MIIKATQKNTRLSPRKVRLVANQVRKLPLEKAIDQLAVIERRSTMPILKTLRQAVANAMNNHGFQFADLELENIIVTEGPTYKRWQPVSRGRAHGIFKRSSHITVTIKAGEAPVAAKKEVKAEVKAEAVKEDATPAQKPAAKKTTKKVSSKPKKTSSK